MMKALILVGLVAAPAAFAAGYWQGEHHETTTLVAVPRINAPLVARPGHGVSDAGKYFAALNAPPPPPPPPPAPPTPPPPTPPPPPDVALLFRRDLTAVVSGPQPRVVLTGSRSLRPGEMYRDGWMLTSLTSSTAVLTKGKEQRHVGLFSQQPSLGPQNTVVARAPTAPLAPSISFANAVQPGRPNPGAVAGVVSAMRGAGFNQQQLDRIQSMMNEGRFDQNAAQQMLSQQARNRPISMSQLQNILTSMQRAGVLRPNQAQNVQQIVSQSQNQQQIQQLMQMGGRGAVTALPPPFATQPSPAASQNSFAPTPNLGQGAPQPGRNNNNRGGRGGGGGRGPNRGGPPTPGPPMPAAPAR